MTIDEILNKNIGEPFYDYVTEKEFTVIGESDEGNVLIEWEDGEIESKPTQDWYNEMGYEIDHLADVPRDEI
jgi:hypothetical protein